jgi:hypothetical protein
MYTNVRVFRLGYRDGAHCRLAVDSGGSAHIGSVPTQRRGTTDEQIRVIAAAGRELGAPVVAADSDLTHSGT